MPEGQTLTPEPFGQKNEVNPNRNYSMTAATRSPQVICRSETLGDSLPRKIRILYRGEPMTAILIRHEGVAYGYLNRCVHMPRTLDCERADILDGWKT